MKHVTSNEYVHMSQEAYQDDGGKPPGGWHVLETSKTMSKKNDIFFAVAYIHYARKQVVIAYRGFTLTTDMNELASCIKLGLNIQKSSLVEDAKAFKTSINNRINSMGFAVQTFFSKQQCCSNYRVTYTGHSLGAALATLMALTDNSKAVVFESTGVGSLARSQKYPGDQSRIICYLARTNVLNSLSPQVGKLLRLPTKVTSIEDKAKDVASDYLSEQTGVNKGVISYGIDLFSSYCMSTGSASIVAEEEEEDLTSSLVAPLVSKISEAARLFHYTQDQHSIDNLVRLFEQHRGQPNCKLIEEAPEALYQQLAKTVRPQIEKILAENSLSFIGMQSAGESSSGLRQRTSQLDT